MCRGCDVEGQQYLAAKIPIFIPTAILCMAPRAHSGPLHFFIHLPAWKVDGDRAC